MSSWSDLCARVNASKLATFGEPVVYTPLGGDPVTVTAIRQMRLREEVGAFPQWEEYSLDPAALLEYPAKGDFLTPQVNNVAYAITAVRQPDPYSLVILTLNQRAGQPHP